MCADADRKTYVLSVFSVFLGQIQAINLEIIIKKIQINSVNMFQKLHNKL